MEKKATNRRDSDVEDPLVADLRAIEAQRRDSEAGRQALWGMLQVLPALIGLGEVDGYDESFDGRLVNILREATQQLTVPGHREAAAILMRLQKGSAAIAPAGTLHRLAAKKFPGRGVKGRVLAEGEKDFTMRVDSFTRRGSKHDDILEGLAYGS
jgi:hypothetical protein